VYLRILEEGGPASTNCEVFGNNTAVKARRACKEKVCQKFGVPYHDPVCHTRYPALSSLLSTTSYALNLSANLALRLRRGLCSMDFAVPLVLLETLMLIQRKRIIFFMTFIHFKKRFFFFFLHSLNHLC